MLNPILLSLVLCLSTVAGPIHAADLSTRVPGEVPAVTISKSDFASSAMLIPKPQVVEEDLDFVPKERYLPNIIINAQLKSGSEHIVTSLRKGLGYRRFDIYSSYEPERHTFYSNISNFYKTDGNIAKQHLKVPSFDISQPRPVIRKEDIDRYEAWREFDVEQLRAYTNKLVIHIRDPRQTLLSMVHHINGYRDPVRKPRGYFDWELSRQIDWCIENILQSQVKWIEDWLKLKNLEDADPNGLQILVTTYDELNADEMKLFNKILSFYNINPTEFKYKAWPREMSAHFRKGDPEEWRKVLTEEQQQRMASIVPRRLLRAFNWAP